MITEVTAMAALSEIKTTVEIFNGIKTILNSKDNKKADDEKVRELLFRNYYSEVYFNKKLFETINLDSLKKNSFDAVKSIAPLLKNEFGKAVVASLGKYRKDLHNIQNMTKAIEEADSADDDNETDEKKEKKSLIARIIFTVNRIDVLQRIATLDDDTFLRNINAKVRFQNIQRDTQEILNDFKKSLENVLNGINI